MDLAARIVHKEASTYQSWLKTLLSYAMGGICFILFFDYCTLTDSGRTLVQKVRQEISDCFSEVDFHFFLKPVLLMFGVYFLGILTIIRANFLYMDDIARSIGGYRGWYNWSRYVSEFLSVIIHGDTNLTDISPLPQLLAILILAVSSVLLVYIIGNKKITTTRLLASIPLGLFPFFFDCLTFKFDAPYMALSILASIIPFLFITRKKAFFFGSVISLLIMCMTYQAVSGVYMLIVVILCFLDWNNRKKSNKEILSFLGIAVLAFCFAMLFFRFFLMKPFDEQESGYVSNAMHPLPDIIFGTLTNIKNYAMTINHDLGIIWKIGIIFVCIFFITKSIRVGSREKIFSFFVSILAIGLSFILSYGVYSLLAIPSYGPRALIGFNVFLAILCISVVSDYKKIATVVVFTLNWCLFVFAFSYGNALADQARYAEFRACILLHDLNILYPDHQNKEDSTIQLKNSIDYTPIVKNIAKHYPIVERLVPKQLGEKFWDCLYLLHFNYIEYKMINFPVVTSFDFDTLNLPVVLDSYYHTIQSDGNHILIVLKH